MTKNTSFNDMSQFTKLHLQWTIKSISFFKKIKGGERKRTVLSLNPEKILYDAAYFTEEANPVLNSVIWQG
jgi:hypothetical protein